MAVEKLDFQKVIKENLPYTLILTKVIQNIKDALAGFIWVYLCSLPQNWKINKEHLMNKFQIGDRTMQSIFSYLKRCNLIEYQRERFENGTLGVVVINVLCGDKFNEDEPYKKPTPQKTDVVAKSVDKSTPQKTTRVVNHTSGFEGLQKKHKYKALNSSKKKTKSFYENENKKKHNFAQSMNQMANEKKHIEEHEKRKQDEKNQYKKKEFNHE